MRLLFKSYAVSVLVLAFLARPATTEAQSVTHSYGTFCVGAQNVFTYQGPGTVSYWSVTGPYTIISSNSSSIQVVWNSTTANASVTANYDNSGTPGTAWYPNIAINAASTPSVTISASATNVCAGTAVTFTASPVNGGSNPSYRWLVNGTAVSGATGSSWTTGSLTNGQQVSCLLTSSNECVTTNNVSSNTITMTINSPVNMTATIAGSSNICSGGNAGFTCTVQSGGGNLTYQWKRNGANISSNVGTPPPYALSYTPVNNGDVFSCAVTSDGCYNPATSNSITVSITQPQTFSVGVQATTGLSYCTGQTINFTANTNLPATSYQWQQNGSNITGATGSTYSTTVTSLAQIQGIGCYATTSGACLANTSASGTAASIPFTVNQTVTPSVSIASSAGTSVCSGSPVTFTATAVNGGSSPGYQWQINGASVSGATSSTYMTSSLTNGQQVSCVLTTNAVCATTATATSNILTMTVTQTQQMAVSIDGASTVCQGSPAGFRALVTNTSGNLTYQWMKNGVNISSDGPGSGSIPPYGLQYMEVYNGDVFSCKISSDAACYLPATSNSITVTIAQPQTFSVGIGVSTLNYCQNAPVMMTATANYPVQSYQWLVNGNYVNGATGSTYQATASSVADLQSVSVQVVASGANCIISPNATGNTASIPFSITPLVYPAVSFSSNPANLIVGSPVTYTANPVNGGSQPSYQWQVNGADVPGATSSTFTTTFSSGSEFQNIGLTMSSNAQCAVNPVTSWAQYKIHPTNWENLNYIRVHEVRIPGVSDWAGVGNLAIGDKTQTTIYFDGFWRPIQQVDREKATPSSTSWGDIVTPYAYDGFGRQPQGFLPYTTTTESGRFKSAPLTEQPQYYTNNYGESPAYGQTIYDNSPLNRVTNTKAPGSVWSSSPGNSTSYGLNDQTADNVQIWTAGDNPGDVPVNLGPYLSNTLYKTTTSDSKGNLVIVYANNADQVILKKVEVSKTHTTPYDGWMCTYYVYDDLGLVRFSMEPEAVKYLAANSWSFSGTDILNQLCFRYEYDERERVILKKSPGAKELLTVYDNRDRVVFQQDGNQRGKTPNEWTATLYDDLDRPVLTSLFENSASAQTLKSQVPAINTRTQLTISAQGVTVSVFNSPLVAADLNNAAVTTIVKYSFYDNYSYPGAKAFSTNFSNSLAYASSDPMRPTQRTLGMATGKLVRVLGTANFLETSVYYDEKGRNLQIQEDNIKNGADVTTNQYRFDGTLLSVDTKHSTANTGYSNFDVLTKYVLDARGRVSSTQKKYGSNNFKTISAFDYDDLGRVKTKHLDPGYTGSGKTELEALNYSFNINAQLTGINKDYALKTPGAYDKWGHFFGLYAGYDNKDGVFAANQLDGQSTGVVWSTQGDDVQRKYEYSYDAAGRFINAAFTERQTTSVAWSNTLTDFSVTGESGQIQYDLNGNLLNMIQRALVEGNAVFLTADDLQYQYNTLSNVLIHVSDNSSLGVYNGVLGDFKPRSTTGGNDYVYDDNGNLVVDLNKNIANIGGADGANGVHYNYLDKPEIIRVPGKGTVTILYNAEGTRLQRTFTPEGSSTGTITSYINEFIYQGDNLQYIIFEEGRIRVMQSVAQTVAPDLLSIDGNMDLTGNNRGAYDFFIRDQLGSVRMILTEETHSASNTCTMETARDGNEAPIFGQVDANGAPSAANEVRARFPVANIPGQSTGAGWNDPNIGSYVSQVGNLASSRIGPNMLIKVMAGDQITAQTMYYYASPVTNQPGGPSLIPNLLSALGAAIAGGPATTGPMHSTAGASGVMSHLNGSVPFGAAANPDASNGSGSNPKAYLTVLFFDERFDFVGEGSNAMRVQAPGGATLPFPTTRAPKNGYAFVYVANESDQMVYFDNLQVSSVRANILQESHYYPHGLKIASFSSSAIGFPSEGRLANNYEYRGENAETDPDIGWDEFALRSYDPQIGRFVQQDPYDQFASPYVGMGNDPVNNVDEDGGFSVPGGIVGGLAGFLAGGIYGLANDQDPVQDAMIGMSGGVLLGGMFGSIDHIGGIAGGGHESTSPPPVAIYSQLSQVLSAVAASIAITAPSPDPNSAGRLVDMPLPRATPPGIQNTGLSPGRPSAAPPVTAPPLPVAPPQVQTPRRPEVPTVKKEPSKTSKISYFEEALKHANVKYVWGGTSPDGFDCSGLLCIVTGKTDPRWSTGSDEPPPGDWERVHPSTSSYDDFLKGVQKGDLFVWKGEHAAFYSGDGRLFGANCKGVKSGYSKNEPEFNELKQYWILGYYKLGKWKPGHGYPTVWRQK